MSYCCGNQTPQDYITLNNTRVQIPATAAQALRGIRKTDQALAVWIDAICINSKDPRERAQQVLLMSRIYSSAAKTIVWLESEGDVADKKVADCASEWQRHLSEHNVEDMTMETLMGTDLKVPEFLRSAANHYFASLLVYLKQRWFCRLWVYQEVLLSQRVTLKV